jgi:hypothetical protein
MKDILEIPGLFAGYPHWYKIALLFWFVAGSVIWGARLFIKPVDSDSSTVAVAIPIQQTLSSSPGALQINNGLGNVTVNQSVGRITDGPAKVRAEVIKLLKYPSGYLISAAPKTKLESMLVENLPSRLFDLLMGFDERDVRDIDDFGEALHGYMAEYHSFRANLFALENDIVSAISTKVAVRMRVGWSIYHTYYILRKSGRSPLETQSEGSFFNYGVTAEDAERVYQELLNDDQLDKRYVMSQATYDKFILEINDFKRKL